ncbi:MAG TPA: hypothetical protein VF613_06670 [Longimicrobium sp.]|jgi:hypothetical protein
MRTLLIAALLCIAATPAAPQVSLGAIVVRGGARCEVRPQEGRDAAIVWAEARKALQAAAAAQGTYRFSARTYARRLDPHSRAVLADTTRTLQRTSGPLWVSVPAERLAEKGFMELQGVTAVFYAPYAAALRSDAFVDQHCVRVQASEEGLIGLAFEPVPGRRVPDIRGTMWLDRATAELRRMEYQYTGLRGRRPSDEAGGTLEFRRRPDGAWIVSRWRIRVPLLAPDLPRGPSGLPGETPRSLTSLAEAERWRTMGLREEGGEITSIATRAGVAVAAELPGALAASVAADRTRSTTAPRRDTATVADVVPLEGITAMARSRRLVVVGFYDRQRQGAGHYVGPDDLSNRPATPLSQILDELPSINLVRYRPWDAQLGACKGREEIRLVSRGTTTQNCATPTSATCFMEVYVDGMLVQPNVGRPSQDVDRLVSSSEVAAIEVYRGISSAPAQFQTRTSHCGGVLIWTGER